MVHNCTLPNHAGSIDVKSADKKCQRHRIDLGMKGRECAGFVCRLRFISSRGWAYVKKEVKPCRINFKEFLLAKLKATA